MSSCHRSTEMSNSVKTGAFLIERFEPKPSAGPISFCKYIRKNHARVKTYLKLDKFGWIHMHEEKWFLSNLSTSRAMHDIVHIWNKFGAGPAYMSDKWKIQKDGEKLVVKLPRNYS